MAIRPTTVDITRTFRQNIVLAGWMRKGLLTPAKIRKITRGAAVSPLKLTIPGRYWDSQIYRGRLHLFGMDGHILTLDWDRLVESLRVEDRLRLAVRSAFQRSDFLYGVAATGILDDVDVREIMIRRFHSLSEAPLEVGKQEVDRTTLGEQDNLFPFPHADSEIYNRRLFVSSGKWGVRGKLQRPDKIPCQHGCLQNLGDACIRGARILPLIGSSGGRGRFVAIQPR